MIVAVRIHPRSGHGDRIPDHPLTAGQVSETVDLKTAILGALADHEMNSSARASMWREDFDALKARVEKIEAHLHLNS